MSFRAATQSDQPAIEVFLLEHLETSMFLLSNLRLYGPTGGAFYRAMRFWVSEAGGMVTGCFALSTPGILMMQMPTPDWAAMHEVLRGETVEGAIGDGAQVAAALEVLGLGEVPTNLREEEILFRLPLGTWDMPPVPEEMALAPLADWRDTALAWREAYHAETLGTPQGKIAAFARTDIDGYIAGDSHRMLLKAGAPVAMTGFNAALPEAVQIGGVYTPPELRGRHHARTALALHLAETKAKGVPLAILFATRPDAIRAYESVGFQRAGRYSIVLFRDKVRVA